MVHLNPVASLNFLMRNFLFVCFFLLHLESNRYNQTRLCIDEKNVEQEVMSALLKRSVLQ